MQNRYRSPAKINWFLHITGKRADGYHELETVFQSIDWFDELTIEPRQDAKIIVNGDLSNVAMQENLIYRAALALQTHTQCTQGADIHITKNIPTGAGLGGGSSNAATTLLALNQQWGVQCDNQTLQRIGRGLGADVPFFVSQYPAAFARGIGEQLYAITAPKREVLLVKPNVHVDTRAVYQHPKLVRDHPTLNESIAQLQTHMSVLRADSLYSNDMQAAAFALAPEIAQVYESLQRAVPHTYVRMSGSGATVFALPNDAQEHAALQQWCTHVPKNWLVRWCSTLV